MIKYCCKVEEPGFPVAAVKRGKKVIVSRDITFKIVDHNYTKIGIISSVAIIYNIPKLINGNFYAG
ncbi:4485_t:CDS:1, partial [Funneliformis geosporum]